MPLQPRPYLGDDERFFVKKANTHAFLEPTVAVGPSLTKIHEFISYAVDQSAPHFAPEREPLQDAVAYTATNGQNFYRPQVRLSQGAENRPDLRFLKDINGKVRLEFMLEESNLLPGAEPFNVRVTAVTLRWNGPTGADLFTFPTPMLAPTNNPANAAQPNFQIRVGTELTPSDVERLNYALSNPASGAVLDIAFTYSYWVDLPGGGESPPINPPVLEPPIIPPIIERPVVRPPIIDPIVRPVIIAPVINPIFKPTNPNMFRTFDQMRSPEPEAGQEASPERAASARLVGPDYGGTPLTLKKAVDWYGVRLEPGVVDAFLRYRQTEPNFRSANLTRSLAFTFDPNLIQNRVIYSAIRTGAGVSERWENTPFGYVRRTEIANTVYRLPDEVRLAFSTDLKAPHMVPVLYRDPAEEIRVRVVFQAEPWHDPHQLVALSDFLYDASGGALAAPYIVTGGYREAKLRLTGAFPEQIQVLAGAETSVELDGGFEMQLDLTLEFYRFLCELLVGVGLTGEIVVTLDNPPDAAGGSTPLVRRIPMRLSLDDLAALPIEVNVNATAASPGQVELINRSGSEVRCQAVLPRLLQVDANSVTPLVVYPAETTTVFPVTLAPDTPFIVDVKPTVGPGIDPTQLLWNAVLLQLVNPMPVQSAEAILNRVHEVAPDNSLDWNIQVGCPLFAQPTLPPAYQGKLFSLVVEIRQAGFMPRQVVLTPSKAGDMIKMQRTLQEILREDAQGLATFEHRVKNIYFTQEGQWSDWKSAEGTNLFVYPNPSEV